MTIYVVLLRISNLGSTVVLNQAYLIVYEGPVTAYSRVSLLSTSTASSSTQEHASVPVVSLIGLGSSHDVVTQVNPPGSIVSLIGLGSSHSVTPRAYPSNAIVSLIGLDSSYSTIATIPAMLSSIIVLEQAQLPPYREITYQIIHVEIIVIDVSQVLYTHSSGIAILVDDKEIYSSVIGFDSVVAVKTITAKMQFTPVDSVGLADTTTLSYSMSDGVQLVGTTTLSGKPVSDEVSTV